MGQDLMHVFMQKLANQLMSCFANKTSKGSLGSWLLQVGPPSGAILQQKNEAIKWSEKKSSRIRPGSYLEQKHFHRFTPDTIE